MTYLYNEEKIDAHPEWGRLRQMRYTENFLSGSHETDILLARLYEQTRRTGRLLNTCWHIHCKTRPERLHELLSFRRKYQS